MTAAQRVGGSVGIRRRGLLALALATFAWPAAAVSPPLKEPRTGLEFPAETVFNGRRYEAVHTSHIATRVLGIGTFAAAVAYYAEAGAFDRARDRNAQLLGTQMAKLLVMGFVRPVPAPSLRDLLRPAVLARLPAGTAEAQSAELDRMLYAIDDMKRGDVLQFVWLANGELEVLVRKTTRLRARNGVLARALWEVFLVDADPPLAGKKPG